MLKVFILILGVFSKHSLNQKQTKCALRTAKGLRVFFGDPRGQNHFHNNTKKLFAFFFLTSLLEYNCFTMVCLLVSTV